MEVMSTSGWVHCGRQFSAAEIADLCATVAWLPGLPRQELAATLCEHLSLLQNSPGRIAAPHHSLSGSDFFASEVSLAERLTVWHSLPHSGRTPPCIPRMHSGRRGNAGGHRRNRINWSADSARMPNIRWAITFVLPLTRMV